MHSQSYYIDTSTDEHEAQYLITRSRIRWLRCGLTVLIVATALSIVGCLAHTFHVFHQTNLSPDWWLPLWPQSIDTRPTTALLSSSCVIACLSLVLLTASLIPSPHPRTILLNTLAAVASLGGLVLSIFGVAYYQTLSSDPDSNTIQTWACAFTEISEPADWGRLCGESRAGLNLAILLVILELLSTIQTGFAMWVERRMTKIRDAQQEVKRAGQS
ncbi:MAG: hypothetical protein M1837_006974 [Sclerophora amabilis]|nr:MAG: hypothetical protein M1837_006974 [Sclerophora amabilis]